MEDLESLEVAYESGCGRLGDIDHALHASGAHDRVLEEPVKERQGVRSTLPEARGNEIAVGISKLDDVEGPVGGLPGHVSDPVDEEGEPLLPRSLADGLEPVDVLRIPELPYVNKEGRSGC